MQEIRRDRSDEQTPRAHSEEGAEGTTGDAQECPCRLSAVVLETCIPGVGAPEVEVNAMELVLGAPQGQLDQLLELVCVELQLTDTQYKDAERSYGAVGEWLGESGTALGSLRPAVFPQGSMALGTTVKPRKREEFDLDAVLLLAAADRALWDPMVIYRLVRDRLREHCTYREMLEEKARCLRLNYTGQFHLDVIPACPAPKEGVLWGDLAIAIPDKTQSTWVSTNPRGFVGWFAGRAAQSPARRRAAMSVEPLPPNCEAGSKAPLQRVAQLFKRRRDVHFNGSEFAPKSILLATIDGNLYCGEQSLSEGLTSILDGIVELGELYRGGGVPEVLNPTDPNENLARHWQEDRRHFEKFVEYVAAFREGMESLLAARGLEKVASILEELFDPKGASGAVSRAVNAYAKRFQRARRDGQIGIEKNTGALITVAAQPQAAAVAKTKFWGRQ